MAQPVGRMVQGLARVGRALALEMLKRGLKLRLGQSRMGPGAVRIQRQGALEVPGGDLVVRAVVAEHVPDPEMVVPPGIDALGGMVTQFLGLVAGQAALQRDREAPGQLRAQVIDLVPRADQPFGPDQLPGSGI